MFTNNPPPKPPVTQAEIGCLIHSGVSFSKLQRLSRNPQGQELDFTIKFLGFSEDVPRHLSAGIGTPLRIKTKTLRQGNTGFYITGVILAFQRNGLDTFSGDLSSYYNLIPYEWFQPDFQIQLVHRGAATPGFIINIVEPTSGKKLHFRTKNL